MLNKYLEGAARAIASKAGRAEVNRLALALLKRLEETPILLQANWHPLGFVHCKVGVASGYGLIRLHLWPAGMRATQEPAWLVHQHTWHLDSFVLIGSVINREYAVTESCTGAKRLYEVTYNGARSVLTATSILADCHIERVQTHDAGSHYSVDVAKFHTTTVPVEEFAATLVLAGENERLTPTVVGEISGNASYEYERKSLTPSEAINLVRLVRQRMKEA